MIITGISIKKYNLISMVALLISPFLAIPTIVYGVTKKNRGSLILLAFFYGLLSFLIIPLETNDLASHYIFFEKIQKFNFVELLELLKKSADSVFYILMYIFSKLNLSAQLLFGTIIFFTINNFLFVYHKLFEKGNARNYVLGLFILLLTFLWSFIFIGIRNYFAFSFVLLAIYNGVILDKKYLGFIWLIFASLIHFSSILFIPLYLILVYQNKEYNLIRNLFLMSLVFVFLTKEILLDIVLILPLSENLAEKVDFYLTGKDLVEQGIERSTSGRILYIILGMWLYVAYPYLILTINRKSNLRNIVYSIFIILNLLSVAPDPHKRYSYLARPLFLFLLLYEYEIYKKEIPVYLFMICMMMLTFVDVYVTKDIYANSFYNLNSLSTIGILSKDFYIVINDK